MRDIDTPQPSMGLGRVIKPEPPPPQPEKWTAIGSVPGYERNQAGAVRKADEPVIMLLSHPMHWQWNSEPAFREMFGETR